jgi:DNA topoisomerase IA
MKHFKLKDNEYIRVRSTSIEEHDYMESFEKARKENQKLDENLYNAAIVRTVLDKLY